MENVNFMVGFRPVSSTSCWYFESGLVRLVVCVEQGHGQPQPSLLSSSAARGLALLQTPEGENTKREPLASRTTADNYPTLPLFSTHITTPHYHCSLPHRTTTVLHYHWTTPSLPLFSATQCRNIPSISMFSTQKGTTPQYHSPINHNTDRPNNPLTMTVSSYIAN